MDDVEKVPAAEHSSSSEVPIQTSPSSSLITETEVSLTSASTTPITTPIVNKGKGHADNPETVNDFIHVLPNSSSNSSSTLLPPPEELDPSLAIPVTSKIFAAAAAPTDVLLKKFSQKSMLKNEVDFFFGSDSLYKRSSIIGAKDDLHIIIHFYSEDFVKNTICSAIADLYDVIFHLYDRNADHAAEADRTLLLLDIPLDIKPSHLKSCLACFGLVKKLTLHTLPNAIWQKATVIFNNKEMVDSFYDIWAITCIGHYFWYQPWSLPADANQLCHSFTAILAGLSMSFDVKAGDLHSIWTETKARFINISCSRFSYRPKPYAHVIFPSQKTIDAAMELSFQFNN
ncbi:hypothetical protein C1645_862426 [Glomus cerebriforme]|uniref:Uncharacterized protein n=1 Tax=Glomus cerebriforme TaxID=658196 RepID=A0A397SEC4_9GLOM|nr:hypothetical protein C1645_862426 [Glomus cerebriforme]